MAITERKKGSADGEYEVEFREHRLEEIIARLNRLARTDEKAFEVVADVSDFNQRAYELFAQPLVQAMANETSAQMLREMHPLRMQNWAISNLNPWLWWLAPAAEAVRSNRQPMEEDHPLRKGEQLGAQLVSAALDYYRAMRDAATEAGFFTVYGNMFALYNGQQGQPQAGAAPRVANARELPEVQAALASMSEGGYVEALARVGFLLSRSDEPLPLSRLEMRQELASAYAEYLPDMPMHEWRRVRGTQEIIARAEPDEAVATLPALLGEPNSRARLLALLDKLMSDRRVLGSAPTTAQQAMLARIRAALGEKTPRRKPTLVRARA
jgi:hypothetical protein